MLEQQAQGSPQQVTWAITKLPPLNHTRTSTMRTVWRGPETFLLQGGCYCPLAGRSGTAAKLPTKHKTVPDSNDR